MKHSRYIHSIGALFLFGATLLSSCSQNAMTAMESESSQGTDGNGAQPYRGVYLNRLADICFRNDVGITPSIIVNELMSGSGNSDTAGNEGEFLEEPDQIHTTTSTVKEEFLEEPEESHTSASPADSETVTPQLEDTSGGLQEMESQGGSLENPEGSDTISSPADFEEVTPQLEDTSWGVQEAEAWKRELETFQEKFPGLTNTFSGLTSEAMDLVRETPRITTAGSAALLMTVTVLAFTAKRWLGGKQSKSSKEKGSLNVSTEGTENNARGVPSPASVDTTSTRNSEVAENEKQTPDSVTSAGATAAGDSGDKTSSSTSVVTTSSEVEQGEPKNSANVQNPSSTQAPGNSTSRSTEQDIEDLEDLDDVEIDSVGTV